MKVTFGNSPMVSHEQLFEDFLKDASEQEWDTPHWCVAANEATGHSVMVAEIDPTEVGDMLVAAGPQLLTEISWVAIYIEGFGQPFNNDKETPPSRAFFGRDKSKDVEFKMVFFLSEGEQRMAYLARGTEEWERFENYGNSLIADQIEIMKRRWSW